MQDFLKAVDERVLVCDGAMGTMLYAKGVFINKSFDALNITQPDLVARVHQEYVWAGADIIETNTFGANRIKLASFGVAERLQEINEQGARIARQAAGDRAYVAGAIGPLGIRIEPWGKTGVDEAREFFREQAQALVDGGVQLIVLETFRDLNEIGAAIEAVRSVSNLPIVAQMSTEEDGSTLDGTPPERFAPELARRGATLVGVNCAVGPAPMLDTIERIEEVTPTQLSAQPNAGKPRDVEGRNIYLCSPEYMASYAPFRPAPGPDRRRLLRNHARTHSPDQAGRRRPRTRPGNSVAGWCPRWHRRDQCLDGFVGRDAGRDGGAGSSSAEITARACAGERRLRCLRRARAAPRLPCRRGNRAGAATAHQRGRRGHHSG